MNDLYTENYKILIKNWKQINVKIFHVYELKGFILIKYVHLQKYVQIQHNSYKSLKGIFHRQRENNPHVCMEQQKTPNNQRSLEKGKQS